MAPARRLLLVLLLLVALHARVARAAPWRARGADEGGGNGYPASWLDVGLEPVGHPGDPLKVNGFPTSWPLPVLEPESNPTAVPVGEGAPASRLGSRTEPPGDGMVTDVPAGRTFAAPRLDAAPQPGWRRRGPPRAKYQAEGGKKSPEPSEVLRQMLEQLERGHVRSKPGEESHGHVYEFIQTDSDVAGKTTTSGYNPQSVASLFCPQEVRRGCMIGISAGLLFLPLLILLCCLMIQWWSNSKE
ncbi:uncharacterized protein LOC142415701 [Mycteria americana]|uniref:uncharacterized protein LOC142415701 n=1 Tax=Mycteria americana TaxID=33587 RepID=UPI003F58DA33